MLFEAVGREIDELFAETSASEVARSAERVVDDRAELLTETTELAEARGRFDTVLADSGYASKAQFVHRDGFERAARLNMKEQRKNFEAAFERMEDAMRAPDHLDDRGEALYETHISLPSAELDAAIAEFRSTGRDELANALERGRRTIERDRAAMVDFDARARTYEQEYRHFCSLNDGVGEELEDLLESVEDEIADVNDAREALVVSIEEWQDDAREWAAWTARRSAGDGDQLHRSSAAHAEAVERLRQALAAEVPQA